MKDIFYVVEIYSLVEMNSNIESLSDSNIVLFELQTMNRNHIKLNVSAGVNLLISISYLYYRFLNNLSHLKRQIS